MPLRESHQLSRFFPVIIIGGLFLWMAFQFRESLSFPETNYNFIGETKRVELTPNKQILQRFFAHEGSLESIKIVMGDAGLGFNERIVVTLLDETCTMMIRQAVRDFSSPEPRIFTTFDFEPIYESKGKSFCLSIVYFSHDKERKKRPYIGASEGGAFTGTSYFDSGKNRVYENRSLQFRPSYGYPTLSGRLVALENRLSQYKPDIFKGRILVLGGIFTIGSIVLISFILARPKDAT